MMLPIGSIVYLSEGNQKIMILNRGPLAEQHGKKVFFDYTGALYPQGLDPEQVYYFNDEDIDEVVFEKKLSSNTFCMMIIKGQMSKIFIDYDKSFI
mgnify:CR=1 FL=1